MPPARFLLFLALVLAAATLLGPATVAAQHAPERVRSNSPLIPDGVEPGGKFRLIFVTSTTRGAALGNISSYNGTVQRAAANNSALPNRTKIRALGSTGSVDARVNADLWDSANSAWKDASDYVPIYWVGGDKVADSYSDLCDGSWDDVANPRDETGAAISGIKYPHTGSDDDCTAHATQFLGNSGSQVQYGTVGSATLNAAFRPMFNGFLGQIKTLSRPLYGLSQVFEVDPCPDPDGNGRGILVEGDGTDKSRTLLGGEKVTLKFSFCGLGNPGGFNLNDYRRQRIGVFWIAVGNTTTRWFANNVWTGGSGNNFTLTITAPPAWEGGQNNGHGWAGVYVNNSFIGPNSLIDANRGSNDWIGDGWEIPFGPKPRVANFGTAQGVRGGSATVRFYWNRPVYAPSFGLEDIDLRGQGESAARPESWLEAQNATLTKVPAAQGRRNAEWELTFDVPSHEPGDLTLRVKKDAILGGSDVGLAGRIVISGAISCGPDVDIEVDIPSGATAEEKDRARSLSHGQQAQLKFSFPGTSVTAIDTDAIRVFRNGNTADADWDGRTSVSTVGGEFRLDMTAPDDKGGFGVVMARNNIVLGRCLDPSLPPTDWIDTGWEIPYGPVPDFSFKFVTPNEKMFRGRDVVVAINWNRPVYGFTMDDITIIGATKKSLVDQATGSQIKQRNYRLTLTLDHPTAVHVDFRVNPKDAVPGGRDFLRGYRIPRTGTDIMDPPIVTKVNVTPVVTAAPSPEHVGNTHVSFVTGQDESALLSIAVAGRTLPAPPPDKRIGVTVIGTAEPNYPNDSDENYAAPAASGTVYAGSDDNWRMSVDSPSQGSGYVVVMARNDAFDPHGENGWRIDKDEADDQWFRLPWSIRFGAAPSVQGIRAVGDVHWGRQATFEVEWNRPVHGFDTQDIVVSGNGTVVSVSAESLATADTVRRVVVDISSDQSLGSDVSLAIRKNAVTRGNSATTATVFPLTVAPPTLTPTIRFCVAEGKPASYYSTFECEEVAQMAQGKVYLVQVDWGEDLGITGWAFSDMTASPKSAGSLTGDETMISCLGGHHRFPGRRPGVCENYGRYRHGFYVAPSGARAVTVTVTEDAVSHKIVGGTSSAVEVPETSASVPIGATEMIAVPDVLTPTLYLQTLDGENLPVTEETVGAVTETVGETYYQDVRLLVEWPGAVNDFTTDPESTTDFDFTIEDEDGYSIRHIYLSGQKESGTSCDAPDSPNTAPCTTYAIQLRMPIDDRPMTAIVLADAVGGDSARAELKIRYGQRATVTITPPTHPTHGYPGHPWYTDQTRGANFRIRFSKPVDLTSCHFVVVASGQGAKAPQTV